jgi:hypothetical protein
MHEKRKLVILQDILHNKDERPQKGAWAPGNYFNTCLNCGKLFIGDKRACCCASCAYSESKPETITDEPVWKDIPCTWVEKEGIYYASCGDGTWISANQETPEQAGMTYCFFCGRKLADVPF